MKLLVPVKVSTALLVLIAAPECSVECSTELPMKLLVPVKVSTLSTLSNVSIAPPSLPAELLMKLLVPLRVSTTLVFI